MSKELNIADVWSIGTYVKIRAHYASHITWYHSEPMKIIAHRKDSKIFEPIIECNEFTDVSPDMVIMYKDKSEMKTGLVLPSSDLPSNRLRINRKIHGGLTVDSSIVVISRKRLVGCSCKLRYLEIDTEKTIMERRKKKIDNLCGNS